MLMVTKLLLNLADSLDPRLFHITFNVDLTESSLFWINAFLKVVGSNPGTVYWMDIFSHIFVVKIVMFV